MIDFHAFILSATEASFGAAGVVASLFKSSAQFRLENLALRQQLAVVRRSAPKRLRLTPADRIFWVCLRLASADWKCVLMIVKPVIGDN